MARFLLSVFNMGRPLRYMPRPCTTFEVTMRTIQSRFLLRPSEQVNDLILGILGRALSLYPVMLHIAVVASNHIHMIITTTSAKLLSDFMRHVNSNIARELGRIYNWHEHFWGRRFTSLPIMDDEKLVERMHYLLSHGCKENLVLRPADWPGVNCFEALVEGKTLEGTWYDRTREYEAGLAGQDVEEGQFATRYEVPLTPLPFLADKTEEEQRAWYRELVELIERQTRERLKKEGGRVLGKRKVLQQNPFHRPKKTKRSPAPACHCTGSERWKAFKDAYREFVNLYREASRKLRQGYENVKFPENCFPPPLAYTGASLAPG